MLVTATSVTRTRRLLVLPAVALLALGLSGCSLVETVLQGPTPQTPERSAPAEPAEPAQFVPGGSADDNLPYFRQVLREFGQGEAPVQGEPVANALIESGFDRAAMQVSFDQSKTGLAADNIFVSVRIEADCLIGQVVAGDRSVAAEVMPAVGPEKDVCLIGETRPIDW